MQQKNNNKNPNRTERIQTVANSSTSTSSKGSSKPKKRIWPWVVLVIAVILVGAGAFVYIRTSSFITATTGGRNAESLLATPTPRLNTPTPIATTTIPPTTAPAQTTLATVTAAPTATPQPPTPTATPVPNYAPIVQAIRAGQTFNLLVLGYGGTGHDGAYLTDTILLLHYDPTQHAVVMTNIPRDLYVFVPYGGPKVGYYGKINSAFSYVMNASSPEAAGLSDRYNFTDDTSKVDAAANLAKDVVEQVTGQRIDYWATFTFDGFRKLIDAIGGVDVTVDTAFDDYEYPANDDADVDASVMHIHFDAGPQHMNGERAIEFARSRKSLQDGSDFARSKRQMKLVQAVEKKMSDPSIFLKVFDIMDALQGSVRTSFTFDELHALFDYYRSTEGKAASSDLKFVSQILDDQNLLYDSSTSSGDFILLPNAGNYDYEDIHNWVQAGYTSPSIRAENANVAVMNGTGTSQYNAALDSMLQGAGFWGYNIKWANTITQTTITDYTKGQDKNTLTALLNLFPGSVVKQGTDRASGATGPDIVLTVGQDFVDTMNGTQKLDSLQLTQTTPSATGTDSP